MGSIGPAATKGGKQPHTTPKKPQNNSPADQELHTPPQLMKTGSATVGKMVFSSYIPENSIFRCRHPMDWIARVCFVGIFVIENCFHFTYFDMEMEHMVAPALKPLPRQVGVGLHVMHIVLGLLGASFVIISGFDAAGRTALRKGSKMMMIFMITITCTWWLNRGGIFYTDVDTSTPEGGAEKRNRLVHVLKNISIFGGLNFIQRLAMYDEESAPTLRKIPLEGLVTSLRVWSLPAAGIPMLLSFVYLTCCLKIELAGYSDAIFCFVSLLAVQCAANLLNSYCDFRSGCDTRNSVCGDRTLVDGLVTPEFTVTCGSILFGAFACYMLYLLSAIGPIILVPGVVGILLAVSYSAGPFPLKYNALGDVTIVTAFGPCIAAFASLVVSQGAVCPLELLVFSLPVTAYTVAILHANNIRDIRNDLRVQAQTVATKLGEERAFIYYDVLLFCGAHLGVLLLGLFYLKAVGVVTTLWVLPLSIWLRFRIRSANRIYLNDQDEKTGKCQMIFGLVLCIGLASMPGTEFCAPAFWACGVVTGVLHLLA